MARKPAIAARPSPKPLLEWIVAGIGLVLTLGTLGGLTLEALAPRTPPDLSARELSVLPGAAGFRVEVEVSNRGRMTAAAVDVEGVLTPPAGAPETAAATLDYVSGGGTETLTLRFHGDPRRGRLDLAVRGWSEP